MSIYGKVTEILPMDYKEQDAINKRILRAGVKAMYDKEKK